jgi:hypothetical protein
VQQDCVYSEDAFLAEVANAISGSVDEKEGQMDWSGADFILDESKQITRKDRNAEYGMPEDNFSDIALMWSVILDTQVSQAEVARMMIALKLCRDQNASNLDNRTDIVGYTLCLERVDPTFRKED